MTTQSAMRGDLAGIKYVFNTSINQNDLQLNQILYNSNTLNTVSNIYISKIDKYNINHSNYFDHWESGFLLVQGNRTNLINIFYVSNVIYSENYYILEVDFISGNNLPLDNIICVLNFSKEGQTAGTFTINELVFPETFQISSYNEDYIFWTGNSPETSSFYLTTSNEFVSLNSYISGYVIDTLTVLSSGSINGKYYSLDSVGGTIAGFSIAETSLIGVNGTGIIKFDSQLPLIEIIRPDSTDPFISGRISITPTTDILNPEYGHNLNIAPQQFTFIDTTEGSTSSLSVTNLIFQNYTSGNQISLDVNNPSITIVSSSYTSTLNHHSLNLYNSDTYGTFSVSTFTTPTLSLTEGIYGFTLTPSNLTLFSDLQIRQSMTNENIVTFYSNRRVSFGDTISSYPFSIRTSFDTDSSVGTMITRETSTNSKSFYSLYVNLDTTYTGVGTIYPVSLMVYHNCYGNYVQSTGTISGLNVIVRYYGSGQVSAARGIYSYIGSMDRNSIIDIGKAYEAVSVDSGGGLMDFYAYYCASFNATINNYGVYFAGESRNYMSGCLSVGINSTSYQFYVQGNTGTNYVSRIEQTSTTGHGLIVQLGQTTPTTDKVFIVFRGGDGGVNGTIKATGSGGVAYNVSSDRRIKRNITTLDEEKTWSEIKNLNPIGFTHYKSGCYSESFIAQDAYIVNPLFASKPDDEKNELWQLSTTAMIPTIVSVLQQTQSRIEILEDQVKDLAAKIGN